MAATNSDDIGQHDVDLTIAMANYPAITLLRSFRATITTCIVTALTFTTTLPA